MNNHSDLCIIIKKNKLYNKNNQTMFKFKCFDGNIIEINIDIELNSIDKLTMLAKMLKIKDIYSKDKLELINLIKQKIVYLNSN